MKLSDIVAEKAIIASLEATERESVVIELVDALVASGHAESKNRQEIIDSILERERRGSTGFGKGVAVPHVKHSSVDSMIAAIGVSRDGVDFDALDKQLVYTVFLLLSPADKPEEHLQAMEIIFKNLSQDRFRRFLRQAESVDDITSVIHDADNQQLGV